jgi:hypothetical protein
MERFGQRIMATNQIDNSWLSDTITITSGTGNDTLIGGAGGMAYSSVDYGAIPTLDTIDIGQLSITGATGANVIGIGTPSYTIGNGGTGGTFQWPNTIWTTNTTASPVTMNQAGKISLQGENADIEINGQSLMKMLEIFQERLGWMQPNPELEKEWDDLRELGEQYRELEKRCKEKAEVWKKLKAMPPPQVD